MRRPLRVEVDPGQPQEVIHNLRGDAIPDRLHENRVAALAKQYTRMTGNTTFVIDAVSRRLRVRVRVANGFDVGVLCTYLPFVDYQHKRTMKFSKDTLDARGSSTS